MSDSQVKPGQIQFYDNHVPSLEAGTYTITVQQDLPGVEGAAIQAATQEFEVRGPQFALDPNEIESVYPPRNSNGDFAEVLPYVVFNQRVLPWERLLHPDAPKATPWLALLTFKASNAPTPETEQVDTLLSGGIPNVFVPQIDTKNVPPDVRESRCQTITISVEQFRRVAPREDELPYLAHVRQIDTTHQEVLKIDEHGGYSVVVSNRFPTLPEGQTSEAYVAHLVTLEGLQALLTHDAPSITQENVRVVTLAHWSFVATAPKENFAQLMKEIVDEQTDGGSGGLLRLPDAVVEAGADEGVSDAAKKRLEAGYVPLGYHTPVGETTFAWYRGPLTPVKPPDLPRDTSSAILYRASSDAMIYDEHWGVFDQSYAAAWTLGRSMGLADKHFATTLLNMRRKAHQIVDRLHAAQRTQAIASGAAPAAPLAVASDAQATDAQAPDGPEADGPEAGDPEAGDPEADTTDWSALLNPTYFRDQFDTVISGGLKDALTKAISNAHTAPSGVASSSVQAPLSVAASMRERDEILNNPKVRELTARLVNVSLDSSPSGSAPATALATADADAAEDTPLPLPTWLARRRLLLGLPFNHLVPDPRMLPVESIRFFYVDPQWLDVLCDGAVSLGIESSRDVLLHDRLHADLQASTAQEMTWHRDRERNAPLATLEKTDAPPVAPAFGFLLRSALVSGLPGLNVEATKTNADGAEGLLTPLRIERLSPSVLLALYPDVPDAVSFAMPHQHFQFGMEDDEKLGLKALKADPSDGKGVGKSLGTRFPDGDDSLSTYFRAPDTGVLTLMGDGGLVPALQTALKDQLGEGGTLSPADFAVQMIRLPEKQVFQHTPPAS